MKLMKISMMLILLFSSTLYAQESNQTEEEKPMDKPKHEEHHGKGKHGKGKHGEHHGKHHGKHDGKHHGKMPHDFNDQKWIGILNDPKRDEWQKPSLVVDQLNLQENDVVADLGAGAGYFVAHLAPKIKNGKVYALDVAPQLLDHIKSESEKNQWKQVETVQITDQDLKLSNQSLDKLLIVNTWHHLPQTKEYAQKVGNLLKSSGKLYLVEFTMEAEQGPPKEHRIEPKTLIKQWQDAGFKAEEVKVALPQQYMVVVYQ